jgi:erythromycin esterase-like protein
LLNVSERDKVTDALWYPRLERTIGVVYLPETDQFDAVLHFDETRAVEPLERTAEWEVGEAPETFPFGV